MLQLLNLYLYVTISATLYFLDSLFNRWNLCSGTCNLSWFRRACRCHRWLRCFAKDCLGFHTLYISF